MDPLSITASILAILTAAQKVSACIGSITSKSNKAPEEMLELKVTVDTTHAVLSQLQAILFSKMTLDASRPALVLVDQVVVILTACVQIFSDLNAMMQALNSSVKIMILDRVRWAIKTTEVKEYSLKLETQKNSLNLILTILTCESMFEANDAVERLEVLVERVLGSNEGLARRMSMLAGLSAVATTMNMDGSPQSSQPGDTNIHVFEFEQDLESSRVYASNFRHENDGLSIRTRADTLIGSILSGRSLADVANIGDITLPITIEDLSGTSSEFLTAPDLLRHTQPSVSESNARRVTFIASTEYDIENWAIRIKVGPLGVLSQLISRVFTHVDLIWVVPCVNDVNYPIDQIAEPFNVQVGGSSILVTVQYHKFKNITFVILNCDESRKNTKAALDETGYRTSMSPRYCAIWNQSISKIMHRFHFDDTSNLRSEVYACIGVFPSSNGSLLLSSS